VGCTFAGRELNPLDRSERFQVTSILLPRTFLTQAGTIVVGAGYDAAFLFLAAIATAGLVLFQVAMPETRDLPAAVPDAATRAAPV